MLMKSPSSPKPGRRIAESIDAALVRLWSSATNLYRAAKHRRDIAALAYQDDYLLADIGLTREDVLHAVAQPIWRDPTATLQQTAGAARRVSLGRLVDSSSLLHHIRRVGLDRSRPAHPRHFAQALHFDRSSGRRLLGTCVRPPKFL